MKKFIVILICGLIRLQSTAQTPDVIIGNVRYDGFQKITKGAMWATRPEAKMVYEGSIPPGIEVYTLETDYYLRFIDGEHNNFDRNYIIAPKGTKVYMKGGNYYLAICGNQIEYLRPVDKVRIVEVQVPVLQKKDTVYVPVAPKEESIPEEKEEKEEVVKEVYYFFSKEVNNNNNWTTQTGWGNGGYQPRGYVRFEGSGGRYQNYQNPYPQQVIRTMPPGIPANNNGGNGGISAPRRSMPRGIPRR